ncbi:GAF domain-containing protein [Candidatus Aquiluna sp. UB-MaderosW2red]|nr:GAF domain-containing protein [Candidatus Aquiluna sp. UB-MaderosW2red]
MQQLEQFTQRISACRNFSEICQLLTMFEITNHRFAATILATIDADARIREIGRYGLLGSGPSKESVALSSAGRIAQALQNSQPTVISDLLEAAQKGQLTPESDIDAVIVGNNLKSALVVPLYDQGYLYGVVGLASMPRFTELPEFKIDYQVFQSLLSMAIRAVTYRNIAKTEQGLEPLTDLTIREQTVLALLAQDKSNSEIAAELNFSLSSVKSSVAEILKKLSVSTRKQAGIKARYSQLR